MKVFSWMGFVLIIPILALNIGSSDTQLDAVKARREKAREDAREIDARLTRLQPGAVERTTSAPQGAASAWPIYVPALFRPAGRRPQRIAGD